MKKSNFDENGFPIDEEEVMRTALECDISVETVEIILRRANHKLAATLRNRGMNIPTDRQQEADFMEKLLRKVYKG